MVTDAYAYGPYGELLAHQGRNDQPFTYQSRWGVRQEGMSGTLYHLRARYYDAMTARFLSRDPIWPQVAIPKEVNPYLYVGNDPVNNGDPRGTDFFGDLWQYDEGHGFEEVTPTNEEQIPDKIEQFESAFAQKVGQGKELDPSVIEQLYRIVGAYRAIQIRRRLEALRRDFVNRQRADQLAIPKVDSASLFRPPPAQVTKLPSEGVPQRQRVIGLQEIINKILKFLKAQSPQSKGRFFTVDKNGNVTPKEDGQ